IISAAAGLYFTWMPEHATQVAIWAGVGRGVDLILYIWVSISLIVLLNLHLKLRSQMELVTVIARTIALAEAHGRLSQETADNASGDRLSSHETEAAQAARKL